jgi:hypothetical protein
MVNVAPPRFVRPPAAGPGDPDSIGPPLREAFAARQDRLPGFLERLLRKLFSVR